MTHHLRIHKNTIYYKLCIYFVPHKAWLKSRIEGIASKEHAFPNGKTPHLFTKIKD